MNETNTTKNYKSGIIFLLAIACFFILLKALPFAPKENAGLALLAFVAILWLTEALHVTVTALLVPLLAIALDLVTTKQALVAFADPTIFLFFGGFALATALHMQKLDKMIANKIMAMARGNLLVAVMYLFSTEILYQELIKSVKKYHPSTDISMIEKAYKVASEAHKDQKRKSGEPYIIHPLCVAIILADLELDKETIVAGLLHDAVEDTWMTYEEVEKEFGSEVALLVDGVTKLGQLCSIHSIRR